MSSFTRDPTSESNDPSYEYGSRSSVSQARHHQAFGGRFMATPEYQAPSLVSQTLHHMNMIGMPGYAYDHQSAQRNFTGQDLLAYGTPYELSPLGNNHVNRQYAAQGPYLQRFSPPVTSAIFCPSNLDLELEQPLDRRIHDNFTWPLAPTMTSSDLPNIHSSSIPAVPKICASRIGSKSKEDDEYQDAPFTPKQTRRRPKNPPDAADPLRTQYPSWYFQIDRNPLPCPPNYDSRTSRAPEFNLTEQRLTLFDHHKTRLLVELSASMLHDYLRWHWDWQIICIQRKDYFRIGRIFCHFLGNEIITHPQKLFIRNPRDSAVARVIRLQVAVGARRWDDKVVQLWQQPNVRKLALGWVPERVEVWPDMPPLTSDSRASDKATGEDQGIIFHHLQFAGEQKEPCADVRYHNSIGRRYKLVVQLLAELEDSSEHLIAFIEADPIQLHGRNPGYFFVNEGGTKPRGGVDDPAPEGRQRKKRRAKVDANPASSKRRRSRANTDVHTCPEVKHEKASADQQVPHDQQDDLVLWDVKIPSALMSGASAVDRPATNAGTSPSITDSRADNATGEYIYKPNESEYNHDGFWSDFYPFDDENG